MDTTGARAIHGSVLPPRCVSVCAYWRAAMTLVEGAALTVYESGARGYLRPTCVVRRLTVALCVLWRTCGCARA